MSMTALVSRPLVSVLVPAKDEAENLPEFMRQAAAVFASEPGKYEVIVIDDGSSDATPQVLAQLEDEYPFLQSARHMKRRGIADALRTGYLRSRG
ncbi:MAG: glycosyltransferase, partial [Gemmatimonadaceae bacterium]